MAGHDKRSPRVITRIRQMLPGQSTPDRAHGRLANVVLSSKRGGCCASALPPNFVYRLHRQLCPRGSCSQRQSSLLQGILGVIPLGPEEQMIRAHARTMIAVVQHARARRDLAEVQSPREEVGQYQSAVHANLSVPWKVRVIRNRRTTPRPHPASRRFPYPLPESCLWGRPAKPQTMSLRHSRSLPQIRSI